MSVRTTVTFEEDILKLLKLKAVETSHSVSQLINALVIDSFREDSQDLKVFEERKDEESISFESFMKKLEADGKL
ncbi:MAG: CopG family transcriptional regulator [Sulfurovum sp.]|nr:MAG: CopG family transcriptional regulator [Sulfurovum sp.]